MAFWQFSPFQKLSSKSWFYSNAVLLKTRGLIPFLSPLLIDTFSSFSWPSAGAASGQRNGISPSLSLFRCRRSVPFICRSVRGKRGSPFHSPFSRDIQPVRTHTRARSPFTYVLYNGAAAIKARRRLKEKLSCFFFFFSRSPSAICKEKILEKKKKKKNRKGSLGQRQCVEISLLVRVRDITAILLGGEIEPCNFQKN